SVAFQHNGRFVITGSVDKSVRVWDIQAGKQTFITSEQKKSVLSVAISPDNKWIASSSADSTLLITDLTTGKTAITIAKDPFRALSFSLQGNLLAAAGRDGPMHLWEIPSGREIIVPESLGQRADHVTFSPTNDKLLVGVVGEPPILWDIKTGMEQKLQ